MRHLHFVGIGGIGMSALAEILYYQGFFVSGSDIADSETVERLRMMNIPVAIGHRADNIAGADVVVYSSAVDPTTNLEILAAKQSGIVILRRAEMLAQVTRLGNSIAVAGTHGKTTTTSLCGLVLIEGGFDPTVIVGGRLHDFGGSNARLGHSRWFVVEADEYDRSFLQLMPSIAIITNIEAEHLDIYGSTEAIEDAFVEFAQKVPFHGAIIACGDDVGVRRILPRLYRRVITYGMAPDCHLRLVDLKHEGLGSVGQVLWHGSNLGTLRLRIPGRHNASNALAAVALGLEVGLEYQRLSYALENFTGVARRFQIVAQHNGITVIDDYAHHPTEITATLATARQCFPNRRLIAVFQPHTYTRTRDFALDFARSLLESDIAVVTDVYPAREKPIEGITGEIIATAAMKLGHPAAYYEPLLDEVQQRIDSLLAEGDIVLTLGAGNVCTIAQSLSTLRVRG